MVLQVTRLNTDQSIHIEIPLQGIVAD